MLPCHCFYICGTWRSNEVRGLKLSYGWKGKSYKEENFYGEGGGIKIYPGS